MNTGRYEVMETVKYWNEYSRGNPAGRCKRAEYLWKRIHRERRALERKMEGRDLAGKIALQSIIVRKQRHLPRLKSLVALFGWMAEDAAKA